MLDNNDDEEDDEKENDETSDDEKHNGDQTGYISATFAVSYALAGIIGQSRLVVRRYRGGRRRIE